MYTEQENTLGDAMRQQTITENTLFYGDNLDILREYIHAETIDLVYLDPPFNSSRNYNVLFKSESGAESESQITAFEDTWHWNNIAEGTYHQLLTQSPDHIAAMIEAMRKFIGSNQMMAYLVMMTVRLAELHRVLKPTGSLYLHCDSTASHYLKIILDTIFNPQNFKNEIIWKRTTAHSSARRYGTIHDTVLFYSKSDVFTWNAQFTPYSADYIASHYNYQDPDGRVFTLSDLTGAGVTRDGDTGKDWHGYNVTAKGRHWAYSPSTLDKLDEQGLIYWPTNGGWPRHKRYLDTTSGTPLQDVWDDIFPVNSMAQERLGYPTQKPLALLERIINASSNKGDIVLDPFCGCGTAVAAAQKLERTWIGIDITHLSIALQKYRLAAMFPDMKYKVIGEPNDIGSAHQLASEDRYQFQWWACSLIKAQPQGAQEGSKTGKKGSDKGIDGIIPFVDDHTGKRKRVLVQVKSGHVKSGDIRDLIGTMNREEAHIGVFITLEEPSRDMKTEAVSAGFYHSPGFNRDYPRVQILSISELLQGAEIKMPPEFETFKRAQRIQPEQPDNLTLF
jgi:site-specific DNA-methyltransferase (adenine-specific)